MNKKKYQMNADVLNFIEIEVSFSFPVLLDLMKNEHNSMWTSAFEKIFHDVKYEIFLKTKQYYYDKCGSRQDDISFISENLNTRFNQFKSDNQK